MEWWRRMVKRALVAVAAHVKPRKNGKGILKLHNDVQTCEYKDVQVMWEILQKTDGDDACTTKLQKQEIRLESVLTLNGSGV